ncbi:hypothetical protein [Mycolicibacterium gadium]|uniref:Uncharacterized protein n=1 Tax=Mycolicibacterium gadium TaxID=1794 RepID=A0A7I7WM48_MYCGU|nr:hypothetical protein [Mycolicibacterium gadium]BBZ18614.1 hypothetical protein MGAD_29490 [Mycolicibacterium gadium]
MTETFSAEVQSVVGPMLSELGFELDAVDDNVDEGGRRASVVYYRADDCKIQIYQSAREGNINCMIGPVDAPNEIGLHDRSGRWQYLPRFSPQPDVPLEELVKSVTFAARSDAEQLERVKTTISENFETARSGILEMFKHQ